jgi:hypothetical protein
VYNRLLTAARRAAGPFLLLLVTIGLFWKLVLSGGQYTWLSSPDLSSQVLPWLNLQARLWQQHVIPLWDPYNWGGQPLVGRTEPSVMYPLNWLLFALPLDAGRLSLTALNWYYVLTHFMGALFCFFLCRDLRRSVAASILAGAVFGMGSYLGTTGWPQMVNGAVWGPLVVMFFLRATRGQRPLRSAALSGAFLGVSLLSGHHQIPTFVMLLIGALWIYYLAASGWRVRHYAAIAAAFGGMAFLTGAAQLLPSIEYARLAVRWVGSRGDPIRWGESVPYLVHSNWALNPVSLLGIVLPGIHPYTNPYVGFTVVALALIAVAVLWARQDVRVFGGVAVGGFLFALGGASVLHGVIYALVPMAEKARNASMAAFVLGLGLAVLAAFGLDALTEERERAAKLARRIATACWISAGLVYLGVFAVYLANPGLAFGLGRLAAGAVGALLAGALLMAAGRGAISLRAARCLLVLLVIHELGNVAGFDFLHRDQGWQYLDQLNEHADIAGFLSEQPGLFRVHVERADIPYNFGEWYDIEECNGNSGVTANIFAVNGERNAHALLGERYSIRRKPASPDQAPVFTGKSGIGVFPSPDAFPRVWAVHEAKSVATPAELSRELAQPLSELRRRVPLYEAAPKLDSCSGSEDNVRLVERATNQTVIQANMACRSMVILADTWFPGWQAEVDGRPATVYEAYGFLRGVVVDPGDHRVVFRYSPASVKWGAALSALGLLCAALLLL